MWDNYYGYMGRGMMVISRCRKTKESYERKGSHRGQEGRLRTPSLREWGSSQEYICDNREAVDGGTGEIITLVSSRGMEETF